MTTEFNCSTVEETTFIPDEYVDLELDNSPTLAPEMITEMFFHSRGFPPTNFVQNQPLQFRKIAIKTTTQETIYTEPPSFSSIAKSLSPTTNGVDADS